MSGDKGISAFPESDNLFKWIGTIHGAPATVDGSFPLKSVYLVAHSLGISGDVYIHLAFLTLILVLYPT